MSVQGTPSTRWARRSRAATCAVSCAAERSSATSTVPGRAGPPRRSAGAARRRRERRCGARPGRRRPRAPTRAGGCGAARRSRSPRRRSMRSKSPPDRRGSRVAARSVQPLARKRGSAPRKVCTATSGSPTSTMRGPPGAMTRSSRAAAGRDLLRVVDDDEPDAFVQPGQGARVVLEEVGDGGEHPRGVVGAVPAQRGDLVVLPQHLARGDPLGALVLGAEPLEVVGPLAELDRAHEQVAQLVAKSRGCRAPRAGRRATAAPPPPRRRARRAGHAARRPAPAR